jgi:transposase
MTRKPIDECRVKKLRMCGESIASIARATGYNYQKVRLLCKAKPKVLKRLSPDDPPPGYRLSVREARNRRCHRREFWRADFVKTTIQDYL